VRKAQKIAAYSLTEYDLFLDLLRKNVNVFKLFRSLDRWPISTPTSINIAGGYVSKEVRPQP
jgi:hypothetical protein